MSTFKEARAIMAHKLWRALGWAVWIGIFAVLAIVVLIGGVFICDVH